MNCLVDRVIAFFFALMQVITVFLLIRRIEENIKLKKALGIQ